MNIKKTTLEFLETQMCIDIEDLNKKINQHNNKNNANNLYNIIEEYMDALSNQSPKEEILKVYQKNIHSNTIPSVLEILDSLRHSFNSYASGGLKELYVYQENGIWYPKIILKSELKPNDIHLLEKMTTIYRGCDNSELITNTYGQAWTTSKEIARLFAYEHYSSFNWFNLSNRIVITAIIEKEDIYFSDQKGEFEIVVNTSKLKNVIKLL